MHSFRAPPSLHYSQVSLSLYLSRLGLLSQYHHHNDENYIENYKDDDDDNYQDDDDGDDDDDDDNGRPCAGEGMISTVSCEPIRVGTTFPVLFHWEIVIVIIGIIVIIVIIIISLS